MHLHAPRGGALAAALFSLVAAASCTRGAAAPVAAVPAAPSTAAPATDTVVVATCEPPSLSPPAITERCGRRVSDLLFSGLVEYDPRSGQARWGRGAGRAMARVIASVDGRVWRVELEPGWRFHDGSPVTARSFADAWNHVAYGPNGHPNAYLFSRIDGFDRLRCSQVSCQAAPASDELRGVEVIDERTLRITLVQADRLFPSMLGHPGFAPLPAQALEDPAAFAATPVGNGPFRLDGGWQQQDQVALVRFEGYGGTPASVERLDLRVFRSREEAYRAFVAGDVDVVQDVPPARVAGRRQRSDAQLVDRIGDRYTFLAVPAYAEVTGGGGFVTALSMAIDRPQLIQDELSGTAVPARSLVAPVVPSRQTAQPCGAGCRRDPEAARQRLGEEGGWPQRGLAVWFHDTSDNRRVARAIAREWRRVFDLQPGDVRLRGLPLNEFLAHLEDRRAPGLHLLSWVMDFPSPRNYLDPLHGPRGLFNFDGYHDVEVARQLDAAASAPTVGQSLERYAAAELAILADHHHVPLWFERHAVLHARHVGDVTIDPFGRVRLEDVTLAAADD